MVAPIIPILITIGGQVFRAAATKVGQKLARKAVEKGGRVIKNTKKTTKPLTESVLKKMEKPSIKSKRKIPTPKEQGERRTMEELERGLEHAIRKAEVKGRNDFEIKPPIKAKTKDTKLYTQN